MADKPKEPSEAKPKKLEQIIKDSQPYEPQSVEAPHTELVGRIRKSSETGKLILLVSSGADFDHALEISAADVTEHQSVFEDASGESTYSIKLAPGAPVKLVLPPSGAPKVTDPKFSDPKQLDPKQFDPKFSDPKFSDPKFSDPKFSDPKFSDPKFSDPKFSDPKPDPKGDPGPGPGPGPGPLAATKLDQKTHDPKLRDPKFDPK